MHLGHFFLDQTLIAANTRCAADTEADGRRNPEITRPTRPRTDAVFSRRYAWLRLFNGGPCGAAARLAGSLCPVFLPPHGSATPVGRGRGENHRTQGI